MNKTVKIVVSVFLAAAVLAGAVFLVARNIDLSKRNEILLSDNQRLSGEVSRKNSALEDIASATAEGGNPKDVLETISEILESTFLPEETEETAAVTEEPFYSGKLSAVMNLIDRVYIGEYDEKLVTDALAAAMVDGIGDEWSYYISADEYSTYLENVSNSYVGIGVTIKVSEENGGYLIVNDVTPDSPAYHAGIEQGDLIVAVEGADTSELGLTETKNRVRGEEGTDVCLTIRRSGSNFDVTITRASIKTVNVTWELLGDIGYIKIRNFETDCAKDTISAITEATRLGAKGIVFDVRYNPGGLKSELTELLDYILPEGVIFRSERYDGTVNEDRSDANCIDIPMCVLVNVSSYSAAEFFAAALQEYGAAEIVGTQTYGKGYFQQCFPLSDGSAVNISTGKYYTPNGVSLAGVGITPDEIVEISDEDKVKIYYGTMEYGDDLQLQKAMEVIKAQATR